MAKSQREGTITRQHLAHYFVATETDLIICALSSKLRKNLQYPEADAGSRRQRVQSVRRVSVIDPVTIGDRVIFDNDAENKGLIREVLPRRNKISRRAAGGAQKEQLLAANIDQVIPVFSAAQPEPEWEMLDRMLAIAEWQNVPPVICLNKVDLISLSSAQKIMAPYEAIGYPVIYTSTVSDIGKEDFQTRLKDQTTLFMGPSGVGKSSLLNWLQPGLNLRIGEVNEATGEGRHTTTHTQLFTLEQGGLVGDIPGVREFYLWNITPDDIPHLFREFHPHLNQCRFRNCSHVHEPGCAVKQAVETGQIAPHRFASYLALRNNP
jgi:ribosome biogenesis GTPase